MVGDQKIEQTETASRIAHCYTVCGTLLGRWTALFQRLFAHLVFQKQWPMCVHLGWDMVTSQSIIFMLIKYFIYFFQHVVSGKITVWFTIVWNHFPSSMSPLAPPKVQVYTRDPGEYGKENTLICRLSKFHPPDVTVQILKDGVEVPHSHQSDLAFGQDWHFHLSKHVSFTPQKGEKYTCRVTHGHTQKDYSWGKLRIVRSVC